MARTKATPKVAATPPKPPTAAALAANPEYVARVVAGDSPQELSATFGGGETMHRNTRRRIRIAHDLPDVPAPSSMTPDLPETESSVTHGKDVVSVESKSTTIRTLAELLAYAEIDPEQYEVERTTVNKWEVAGLDKEKRFVKEMLYQVKATLRPRAAADPLLVVRAMMDDAKRFAPKYPVIRYPKLKGARHLLEISPFDLHFGKMAWHEETGENYDCKIARQIFLTAIDALITHASGFPVERILFPLGNDFFNTDNSHNTTTAGTPQDVDGRWQKTFREGRKIVVEAIDRMATVAPVDVLIVPGNHDYERAFMLGDSLYCWYRNCPNVRIDNEPTLRKYYEYGQNLIGLTHGDKEPLKNLPMIMATERPLEWSRTRFREFHIGHFHSKRDMMSKPVDEFNGVRVAMLSSVSATDAWHQSKGYKGLRAAEAFVWSHDQGRIGNFSYNVPVDAGDGKGKPYYRN